MCNITSCAKYTKSIFWGGYGAFTQGLHVRLAWQGFETKLSMDAFLQGDHTCASKTKAAFKDWNLNSTLKLSICCPCRMSVLAHLDYCTCLLIVSYGCGVRRCFGMGREGWYGKKANILWSPPNLGSHSPSWNLSALTAILPWCMHSELIMLPYSGKLLARFLIWQIGKFGKDCQFKL